MAVRGSRAERVFRLLLRAYPRAFRDRYGEELVELHRDRLDEVGTSARGRILFWAKTLTHTPVQGILERISALGPIGAGSGLAGVAYKRLARDRGLSLTIVLTLAVGIGANVALFSVVRGAILRPLPFPEADRLVQLRAYNPDVDAQPVGPSPLDVVDWGRTDTGLESLTAWYVTSGTYRTDDWMEEIRTARVTNDFFRVLGVDPALGNDFDPADVRAYGPLMISHGLWLRRFGGDSTVVGQSIVSDGNAYRIAGVMPADFGFPDRAVEAWLAWDMATVYAGRPETRTFRFLDAVGRMAGAQEMDVVERRLSTVADDLARTYPETNSGWGVSVTRLHDEVVGEARTTVWAAFAVVLLVLVVACANVANLLLATVPTRSRELAIRSSLGASRGRIAAELVAQFGMLGALSGLVGLGVGALLLEALTALDAGGIPRLDEVGIDAGVFLFAAGISTATAVFFGLVPAVHSWSASLAGPLRSGVRAGATAAQRRTREWFVGTQVALAVLLVAGSAAGIRSLERLREVDLGFETESLATFEVSLDPPAGGMAELIQYYETLERRLAELPGVEAVGASQTLPLSPVSGDFLRPYRPLGATTASADAPTVRMRIVTPGYRSAMGMRLLAGGDLPTSARAGEPRVALVNQTLADALWPDTDPIDQSFELDFRDGWLPYRVVGVVQDVAHDGPRGERRPEVFLSQNQVPYLALTLVARVAGDPYAWAEPMSEVVLTHDPPQPIHDFVSMSDLTADKVAPDRFLSAVLTVFAGLTLLLATTGIYGVVAYVVGHQRREIGVRMALGADGSRVIRAVTSRAGLAVGLGALCGVAIVWLAGRWLDRLLYGVTATDPLGLLTAALLLSGAAVAAAYLPARKATRVPPSAALREE